MILASVQKSENSFSPSKNCLLNDKSLTEHDISSALTVGNRSCEAVTLVNIGVLFSNNSTSSEPNIFVCWVNESEVINAKNFLPYFT